jgi:hypothetical protein
MFETSHPADDARMRALLQMLRSNPSFRSDADAIEMAWHNFLQVMGMKAPPEYRQCFSDKLISSAVMLCASGVQSIGINLAGSAVDTPVRKLLNEAWRTFWSDTSTYTIWEAQQVERLRNAAVA